MFSYYWLHIRVPFNDICKCVSGILVQTLKLCWTRCFCKTKPQQKQARTTWGQLQKEHFVLWATPHPTFRDLVYKSDASTLGWQQPASVWNIMWELNSLHRRFYRKAEPKLTPQASPPTSPTLLLVVLAEDALGVGDRCRVTRAMVCGLQQTGCRRGGGGGGGGEWGKMGRSLSPGRKCLVRLPSNSWLRSRPLSHSRPPSWAAVRGGDPTLAPGQWRQKILRFHPWRSRQTKHGAGCEQKWHAASRDASDWLA